MKKNLLAILLLFSSVALVYGQTRVITGKVTDQKDGSPLPGVSVTVKGKPTTGTQTSINGTYSIPVPADGKILTFKFLGYKETDVPITGSTLNVTLAEDSKQLSEVVVVGYGTQKVSSITGSITSVSGKETENTPVTTFEQALQGKAAGVNIQSNNGKLGQGISISVRGTASISAGTQPLIVMDGIILNQVDLSNNGATSDPLADINFNDVESFEVLKDASASAIYGARASNGVIIITTKKGKKGTAKINFNAQFGVSEPSGYRQFLDTKDWLKIEERAAIGGAKQDFAQGFYPTLAAAEADYNAFLDGEFTDLAAGNANWAKTKVNTNWQKEAFQTAPQQQYDINFSGGNEKTTYFISGQALNQTGIIKGNAFQRYAGRINVDTKITSNLDIGANLDFTHTYNQRVANDDAFSTPLQIVALSPITPLIDPRTGLLSGTPPGQSSDFPLYYNPLISVDNEYYHTNVYRTIGNIFANWEMVKHLAFRTEFGFDQTNQNEDSYFNSLVVRNTGQPNGFGENTNTAVIHYTVNNYFTYKNVFAQDNSLDVTVGTSYEYSNTTGVDVKGEQFPSDAYKTVFAAALISGGFSSQSEYSFLSYFARANYAYKGKYLLSGSVRDDASSRFGADARYGIFPAGSIGWLINEENFLKNVQALSNLKLRVSYGITGNASIGDYSSQGLFQGGAGYNGAAGQNFFQLANPKLQWERTAQIDVGLDWGFFNNRVSGSVDFYRKNTHDLLLNVNVPETLGIATQTQNIGKLYNQGVEFTIASDNFVGKFRWNTSFNIAYNKNVVTDDQGQIINQGADLNRVVEGQPIGVFYGREYAGVNPANGDALYYLNTKNPDGSLNRGTTNSYNAAQNVPLGNPTPDLTGGITNTFNYKNFGLSFTVYGSFGNKIYNGGGQYMSSEASNGFDNQTVDQLAYWNKPGDITNVPEPRLFYANGTNPSSRYVTGGSYVRLKTFTLDYNFPKDMLAKIKIDRLRIFMNAYNLILITKYKGWDPEVNTDFLATNINLGNDFYSAPQPA